MTIPEYMEKALPKYRWDSRPRGQWSTRTALDKEGWLWKAKYALQGIDDNSFLWKRMKVKKTGARFHH